MRVLQDWKRYHGGEIKARVSNDTLFINFDFTPANLYEKFWMKGITAVRIFSPQLIFFDGCNTNFEMFKLKQKSLTVSMSGKSTFEVESLIPGLDTLNISQKDSSEVVFEMSPEYKAPLLAGKQKVVEYQANSGGTVTFTPSQIKSDEAMAIHSVKANLEGYTLLDVGHAQIQSLQLHIADSSAIILSGDALKKINRTTLAN